MTCPVRDMLPFQDHVIDTYFVLGVKSHQKDIYIISRKTLIKGWDDSTMVRMAYKAYIIGRPILNALWNLQKGLYLSACRQSYQAVSPMKHLFALHSSKSIPK